LKAELALMTVKRTGT